MDTWTLVVVAALIAFFLGLFVGKKSGNVVQVHSSPSPPGPGTPAGPSPASARNVKVPIGNSDWEREAISHLQSGNKIMAIKVVREATGLGLRESKDLVESWE